MTWDGKLQRNFFICENFDNLPPAKSDTSNYMLFRHRQRERVRLYQWCSLDACHVINLTGICADVHIQIHSHILSNFYAPGTLHKKKSNSLHNNISHSTWLETFIHVRNLSLNFSFHASTKEIYYALHTHTHMHFNETHWTNIKIYRPQYTDFALYGHCGRYNSNSFLDVAERSPLHKLYIRTSFLHCCCVQCTLSKRALYDNHERKWVESNVIGNIKKMDC